MRLSHAVSAVILLSGCALRCEEPPDAAQTARNRNKAEVARLHEENLRSFQGNPDMLVLPGLTADRLKKQVVLMAEATGIGKDEIAEFFIIAEDSSHSYEAAAVSFAKPGDVHKALVFIGLQPGMPVDQRALRFWPKGERVLATVADPNANPPFKPFRIERFLKDTRTGDPFQETGLVFTGSTMVESRTNSPVKVYAADVNDPKSIASNYNEPATVLDIPFQADQADVYSQRVMGADHVLVRGALLTITLEPEYRDGRKRTRDFTLTAGPRPKSQGTSLPDLVFNLASPADHPSLQNASLNDILRVFSALSPKGCDPFVSLRFAPETPLAGVNAFCEILSSIETPSGIRVEPPMQGDLYYRAYIPDERLRSRPNRIAQPCELHLRVGDGTLSVVLTHIREIWHDDRTEPELAVQDYPVADAGSLKSALDRLKPDLRVILVFADPAVTHGQLAAFLAPVLADFPTIHVYLNK